MAITIHGERRRIGLALSGGGFRAAAFHLGVFMKLRELRLLDNIDLISCVSGGSIAGGFLAAHWGEADVLERLGEYLQTRSIGVWSVLGGILDPFASRLDKLARSYDRDLFGERKLSDLHDGPRIYINATNLSSGNMFCFAAGERLETEMGELELETQLADHFSISRAVAASSAFPPLFPPLYLGSDEYKSQDVEYVTLSDGGIHDNLGVNPMFRKLDIADYAIVSDAGKPFAVDKKPTRSGAVVLTEAIPILMEQVCSLQFKRLELAHMAGQGPQPLWFSIESADGERRPGDAAAAARVSTNLKKLSPAEFAVLVRHGGALLEHRLRESAPELLESAG
jgi:NTE family protein